MKLSPLSKRVVRFFGALHATLHRARGGRGLGNTHTLLLTTTGRKTGRPISVPLFYAADGDRLYVVASFGGNDEPPGWYRNLTAKPEVEVEVGGRRGAYRARSLPVAESAPIWPKLLAVWPAYASYQKRTMRRIPIVELAPVRR